MKSYFKLFLYSMLVLVLLYACGNESDSEEHFEEYSEEKAEARVSKKSAKSSKNDGEVTITWWDGQTFNLTMEDDSGVMAAYNKLHSDDNSNGLLSIPLFFETKTGDHNITIAVELNKPGEYVFKEEMINQSMEGAHIGYAYESHDGFSAIPHTFEEPPRIGSSIVNVKTLTDDRVNGTFSAVLYRVYANNEEVTLKGSFDLPLFVMDQKMIDNNPFLRGAIDE